MIERSRNATILLEINKVHDSGEVTVGSQSDLLETVQIYDPKRY